MTDQPQYYRISDPLESLVIRIRLRKIFGGSINKSTREESIGRLHDNPERQTKGACYSEAGDELDVRIGWQEKLFGPQELVASSRSRPRHRREVDARGGNVMKLERRNSKANMEPEREVSHPMEKLSEVIIFTYVEKDGLFSRPRGENDVTTGNYRPASYLEEAVLNLPHRASATSSRRARSHAPGSGVSRTAATIQDHLSREDNVKTMHIMAAVDVDMRRAKRAGKVRSSEAGESLQIHEQLLCSIKAHQHGTLEMAPGFSAEEPESGEEGGFLTDHTIKIMDREGARLTAYSFSSPSGGVFSYTVENASEPGGGVEELEAWEAEEASRDAWKRASRQKVLRDALVLHSRLITRDRPDEEAHHLVERNACFILLVTLMLQGTDAAGHRLLGAPPEGYCLTLHAFMEIVSASGFIGGDRLYTKYGLSLPQGWKVAAKTGGDSRRSGSDRNGTGEEEGGGGDVRDDGVGGEDFTNEMEAHDASFAARGTTQVACQACPLAASAGSTGKMTRPGAPQLTTWSMVSRPPVTYGDARLPAPLRPSTMFAPWCPARCVAATSLLLLFIMSLAMGPGGVFCLGFAASIVLALALGGDPAEGATPVAHFGFPAEFHLVNEEDAGGMGQAEQPKIFLTVSSLDHLSRHRVEGYGYVTFPRQPGAHELLVTTWRPVCGLRSHLQHFFVGGAHRLRDPRYAFKPSSFKGSFLSRFGFRTESSGTLRLRLHLVEQERVRESENGALRAEADPGGATQDIDCAGIRTVEEILRMVHAKRVREASQRLSLSADDPAPSITGDTSGKAPAAAAVAHEDSISVSQGAGYAPPPGPTEPDMAAAFGERSTESTGGTASTLIAEPPHPSRSEKAASSKKRLEEAAELLARVGRQLERSAERTQGPGIRRVSAGELDGTVMDLAPPR